MTVSLALRVGFIAWVAVLVVVPLLAVVAHAGRGGPGAAWAAMTAPDALASLLLSVGLSAVVAAIDAVFGLAVAWALVRWDFAGRALLAGLVDLPFAMPTLVAGILLVAALGPQTWLGGGLSAVGLDLVYAWPGMLLALCFVTLPFVVRAVEPVLEELDPAEEDAARILGASELQIVTRILLPPLLPAVVVGASQSFARAVGEFGAMAVMSGNIPRETLVGAVYVLGEVEAGDTSGAAAVSLLLLGIALGVQVLVARLRRPGAR